MEEVSNLPAKDYIIGSRQIIEAIKNGKVNLVIAADNCPAKLIENARKADKIDIKIFEGDEQQLGTKLGKPFPIAMIGTKG